MVNIYPLNKALRVKRSAGYGVTHPIGSKVDVVTSYFEFSNSRAVIETIRDEDIYFNPIQSVGSQPNWVQPRIRYSQSATFLTNYLFHPSQSIYQTICVRMRK